MNIHIVANEKDIKLSKEWKTSSCPKSIFTFNDQDYRFIEKYKKLSINERIYLLAVGILFTIITGGFALCFKKIRKLFRNFISGRDVLQFGIKIKREIEIIKEIKSHILSDNLLKEANNVMERLGEHPVSIRCVDKTQSGFDAECKVNEIWIKNNLSWKQKIGVSLFELTNVIHTQRHRDAWQGAITGKFKTGEEYAYCKEKIEYDGLLRCITILDTLKLESPWLKYKNEIQMGFEYYYHHLLEEEHKNYYRMSWSKIQ